MIVSALLEARSSLANPEAFLLRAFNAHATSTGLDVNQDSALTSSAFLDGIRMISQDVARVPLNVYRHMQPRGKERVRDHPVQAVLDDPNPELLPMQFREMLTSFAVSAGTGFAEIAFSAGGDPTELWPIPPHRVTPKRTPAGQLFWNVTLKSGGDRVLAPENMLVVPGFTRAGVLGVDVVDKLRESIGLTLATERFGSTFFGNNAMPGGYIKVPEVMSDVAYARLEKTWEDKHKGLENAHRVALLEEGAEWIAQGVPPEAAQFLGSRKFQVVEVARALNLPPHKLKDLERATFSNIEEQSIDYVRGSLGPWYVRWEQAAGKRLLTPRERPEFFLEHVIEALLRGDIKTRYEAYATARQNGWFSIDDVREKEGYNSIGEGGGDYHVQVNMMRVEDIGMLAPVADTPPDGDPERSARSRETGMLTPRQRRSVAGRVRQRQAYERLLLSTAERAVRLEVRGVRDALAKGFGTRDRAGFRAAVDEFYERHEKWLAGAFGPVLRSFADVVVGQVADELAREPDSVAGEVDEYVDTFVARQVNASLGQIRGILNDTPDGEEADAIEERVARWEETKAEKTARREATQGMNAFTYLAYVAAAVVQIRWVTVGGNCPLCDMMEGRVVGVREAFLAEGDTLDPGGVTPLTVKSTHRHPPIHSGCNCTLAAV